MASGFNINMWESQETLVKGSPAKMGVMCEHWLVFEVHQQKKYSPQHYTSIKSVYLVTVAFRSAQDSLSFSSDLWDRHHTRRTALRICSFSAWEMVMWETPSRSAVSEAVRPDRLTPARPDRLTPATMPHSNSQRPIFVLILSLALNLT